MYSTAAFTCADACKLRFPAVIGVSDERLFTGQFARNLLDLSRASGDWLGPSLGMHHIDFDVGPGRAAVSAVRFGLWQHSAATPRHCVRSLEASGIPSDSRASDFSPTAAPVGSDY